MVRRSLLVILALGACSPADPTDGAKSETDPVTGPTDTASTETPTPTTPTTTPPTTPTTVETCAASPTLTIADLTARQGRLPVDGALDVTLSEPATVVGLCTADDDPTERHLAVSGASATEHELRFQGLLPDTAYTCRVAPTCPTMAQPAASVAIHTGPSPELPELDVTVDATLGMTGYWTLLPFLQGACSQNTRWLVLYDAEGRPRWWHELPQAVWIDVEAKFDPADGAVVWGGGDDPDGRTRFVHLWDGEVFALDFPPQGREFSHDAKRLADGRILTLDYRPNNAGFSFTGFGVQIHDPATGAVDFDLSSQRYVDEGALEPGIFDAYHANWLDWVTTPADRLYVSLCYDWSIIAVDPPTGDLRYTLRRGEGWTVLDEAGEELGEDALPSCTHGNEIVGDDVLLVYDNGRALGYSQIVEWAVDPVAHTVQRQWQWSEPDDWFEGTLGDVDDLGNGRVLVTQAHPECWSESRGDRSEIVEVDRATGAVASRMTFPETGHTTYRSERYDGCTLMSSTRACPALGELADELAPIVGW